MALAGFAKRALTVFLIGLGALACERASAPDPAHPNVLLVTIDTLRADHVGVYGSATAQTPVLDSLAAQGVRFANAYSTAPTTLASHTSILTGLYPTRHGVRHNGLFSLPTRIATLAEFLQLENYQTAAVVASFVLDSRFGLNQGFQFYDEQMSRFAAQGGYVERPANEVTEHAIAWLQGKRKQPFFLWVHYYDPHALYQPPSPYSEKFREAPYDGEISFVDHELGKIIAWLESRALLDNTIVVVTSDHGEGLGEHGEETHSYTLYDATLAVPLLVRGPNVPAGFVEQTVVSNAGVTPTVLSMLNIQGADVFDGTDLSGYWEGKTSQPAAPAYAETLSTKFIHGWSPLFALRAQRYLYVRAPRAELYDMQVDAEQLVNQLEDKGNLEALRLAAEFEAQLENLLRDQAPATPHADVDLETLRQLEKLGYAMPLAMEEQTAASGMDPKDGLHWLNTLNEARILFDQGHWDEAEQLAAQALVHLPQSPDAFSFNAQIALKMRRLDEALNHAERAISLLPQLAANKVLLGFVYKELGDEEMAMQWFRAVEEMGNAETAYAEAGILWMYARSGKMREAELHETKARQFPPEESALIEIGKSWEHVGEYERALKAYELALENFPDSEEGNMMVAIQMARLGDEEDMAKYLSRAGKEANNPVHQNRLGIVYAARGDFKKAEQIFVEILARHPEYSLAQRNLEIVRSKMTSKTQ